MEQIDEAWPLAVGIERAKQFFDREFVGEPDGVWAAPGRVNLIGEHTDYNDGLCLPIALSHRTYVALRMRNDDQIQLSTDFDGGQRWNGTVSDIAPGNVSGWVAYAAGPVWALREIGIMSSGFDAVLVSCVPLAAGLSSSAAVECAVALAIAEICQSSLHNSDQGRSRLAHACVHAENEIAKAPTGGLDQAASLRCSHGSALLLDCKDGSTSHVPFDLQAHGLELLVINTHTSHSLVDGQYGQRRADCEKAAQKLGVASLRDITDLAATLRQLDDETLKRRVRHVVTEIARVQEFVALLHANKFDELGPIMNASHLSLRDDYDVSCLELDVVVAAALEAGALGARMTGGGFGGCAIALVEKESTRAIMQHVTHSCTSAGTPVPSFAQVQAGPAGARVDQEVVCLGL